MLKENLGNAEKYKVVNQNHQKHLFVMIFLHRVELPSLTLQENDPCASREDGWINLHFLHPLWASASLSGKNRVDVIREDK